MRRVAFASALLSLAAIACGGGGRLFGPEEALTFTASSRVLVAAPTRFETSVTLTNPTTAPITVAIGCGPHILVYSTAARTGTPAYDSRASTACTQQLTDITLGPGGTKTYTATATSAQVLGASGTVGTYYITAIMPVGSTAAALPAGQIDLRR